MARGGAGTPCPPSPWLRLSLALGLGLGLLSAGARGDICFEKLSGTDAIYVQEHPMRARMVVGEQNGLMTLVSLPQVGSGVAMRRLSTWLDLRDRVLVGDETGLLSFAFHPRFMTNGRFFVSYTCDADKHPDCKSACGCNAAVGCTVGQNGAGCSSTTIVAEYHVPYPYTAAQLRPREVRRILGFARPYGNHNGGHVFFGKDGLLYLTSGDGGNQGDPWNLSQNPRSLFGKLLRINVDKFARGYNYSVPWDNPFRGGLGSPLVYALGFRNPWRCDSHPVTGEIVCGDVGGSQVEELNVVYKGFNYEWKNYEGREYVTGSKDRLPGRARSGPVLAYTHDELGGIGCIIGGVWSWTRVNPCLRGKYFYSDYSGPIWMATIAGRSSNTRRVGFKCAPRSPMECPPGGDGSDTEWGEVHSWAKDINLNPYMLTSDGIYRVGKQSTCGMRC